MKIKINLKKSETKQRVTWGFNPVSRVKPSKKIYNRKKIKNQNKY